MIEVIVDPQQLEAMRARLAYIANGATKALYRALNKTASKARTEASKMIRATELRVPASYLNERDGSGRAPAVRAGRWLRVQGQFNEAGREAVGAQAGNATGSVRDRRAAAETHRGSRETGRMDGRAPIGLLGQGENLGRLSDRHAR